MSPLGFRESRIVATLKKFFSQLAVKMELCAKRIITISRIACDFDITKVCSKLHFAAYPLQANKGKCLCITLPEEHYIM